MGLIDELWDLVDKREYAKKTDNSFFFMLLSERTSSFKRSCPIRSLYPDKDKQG